MAGNPDFELVVGVDAGASYDAMKAGLADVIKRLNSDTQKVKLELDLKSGLSGFKDFQKNVISGMQGIGTVLRFNMEQLSDMGRLMADISKKDFTAAFDLSGLLKDDGAATAYKMRVRDYVNEVKGAYTELRRLLSFGLGKEAGANPAPYFGQIQAFEDQIGAITRDLNITKNIGGLEAIGQRAKELLSGLAPLFDAMNKAGASSFDLSKLLSNPEAPVTAASAAKESILSFGEAMKQMQQAMQQESGSVASTASNYDAHSSAVQAAVEAEKLKASTSKEVKTSLEAEATASEASANAANKDAQAAENAATKKKAAKQEAEMSDEEYYAKANRLEAEYYAKQERMAAEAEAKKQEQINAGIAANNAANDAKLAREEAAIEAATQKQIAAWQKAEDAKAAQLAKLGGSETLDLLGAKLDTVRTKMEALKSYTSSMGENFHRLQDALSVLSNPDASFEEKSAAYERFNAVLKALGEQIKAVEVAERAEAAAAREQAKAQQDAEAAVRREEETEKRKQEALKRGEQFLQRVTAAQQNWSRAQKDSVSAIEYNKLNDYVRGIQEAMAELRKTGDIDAFNQKLATLNNQFAHSATVIKTSGNAVKTWVNNGMTQLQSRLAYTFGMVNLFMKLVAEIKKMISTAIEIDTSMNQLQIVTGNSAKDMSTYFKQMSASAKETAQNTKDLIDATTVYARLGYNTDESAMLAKYTAMLQGVGDIEASAAQDALTAIVKAFGVHVDQIEGVMDKLVTVGNNFPISVSQLAEGMNNAGSMLAVAGNSLEQSIALLTAANTTTQDISKASTGLRTIAARIRKTTTELDDLGEAINESKYEEMIQALAGKGVSLTDANGEYRSTYEVLKDIARVWDELGSMDQAAIIEALAGTRQQNVFSSLITQFQEAENAVAAMEGSGGALESAYSTYLDSIQAHVNQLKDAFTELSVTAVDADFAKQLIDFGTDLVEILTQITSALSPIMSMMGPLGILATSGGLAALFKLKDLGTAALYVKGLSGATAEMNLETIAAAVSAGTLTKRQASLATSMITTTATTTGATGAVSGFSKVMTGLSTAMKTNPFLVIALAASIAIPIITSITNAVRKHREEIAEQGRIAAKEADEITDLYKAYQNASAAYEDGTASKDQLKSSTDELLSALGMERWEIEHLVGDYEDLGDKIKDVTKEALDAKRVDMSQALSMAESSFTRRASSYQAITSQSDDVTDSIIGSLSSEMKSRFQRDVNGNWDYFLGIDTSTIEGAKEARDALIGLRTEIERIAAEKGITSEVLGQTDLYANLVDTIDGAEDEYKAYEEAYDNLATLIAQSNFADVSFTPKSKEELAALEDSLTSVIEKDRDFKGTHEDAQKIASAFIQSLGYEFDEVAEGVEATTVSVSRFTSSIASAKEAADKLSSAISESFSETGMSQEAVENVIAMFGELEGFDRSKLLERTSTGIHLNMDALSELYEEYVRLQKLDLDRSLDNMLQRYQNLGKQIEELKKGVNSQYDYYELQQKISEYDTLGKQIEQARDLRAEYSGLTSAYRQWLLAQQTPESFDKYENVGKGYDAAKDYIDRGFVNSNYVNKYLDMIYGTDRSHDNAALFEGLTQQIAGSDYSLMDFFTFDENGNATSDGLSNFLECVQQLDASLVQVGEDGESLNFDWDASDILRVSQLTGMSVEAIGMLVEAMHGVSEETHMDEPVEDVENVKRTAEEAADEVEALGLTEGKVEVDPTSVEEAEASIEQVEGALETIKDENGEVDMSAPGAEALLQLLEDLNVKKTQLEMPTLMSFDADNESYKDVDEKVTGLLQMAQQLAAKHIQLQIANSIGSSPEEISALEADEAALLATIQAYCDENGIDFQVNTDDAYATLLAFEAIIAGTPIEDWVYYFINDDDVENFKGQDHNIEAKVIYTAEYTGAMEKLMNGEPVTHVEMDRYWAGEYAKSLKDAGYTDFDFDLDSTDLDNLVKQLEEVRKIKKATGNRSDYEPGSDEYNRANEAALLYDGIIKRMAEVKNPGLFSVDTDWLDQDSEITRQIALLQNLAIAVEQYNAARDSGDNTGAVEAYQQAAETLAELQSYANENGIIEELGVDTTNAQTALDTFEENNSGGTIEKSVTVTSTSQETIGVDDSEVEAFEGADHDVDAEVKYGTRLVGTPPGNIHRSAVYHVTATGTLPNYKFVGTAIIPYASGTAHAGGTAMAHGTAFRGGYWGTQDSGTALGGELGEEILVRDGHWYSIGADSAEMFQYRKGDIIFNADQTEQIFKYGKIRSGKKRASTFASGTAFSWGSSLRRTTKKDIEESTKNPGSYGNGGSGYVKEDEEKEKIDWIEVLIDRIERAIKSLTDAAASAFLTLQKRLQASNDAISKIKEEIDYEQQAYERYIKEANSIGLDSKTAALVRAGKIDITKYSKTQADKIGQYREWYEKALSSLDRIDELHEDIGNLLKDDFDNVATDYDNRLAQLDHSAEMINRDISMLGTKGYLESSNFYENLSAIETDRIGMLTKKREELLARMEAAIGSGEIDEYSEAWYEMRSSINEVEEALADANIQLEEYKNSIRQVRWDAFDYAQSRVAELNSETQFLIELMENSDLFRDNGQPTGKGLATIGLHAVDYNTYMEQAARYYKELLAVEDELKKDPNSKTLIERRQSLIQLQRQSILAAEKEKQAVQSLVEEGIKKELDSLKDLIDKYNEALDSSKDLYDFQKQMAEQTKEVADIQKQLAAYEGDNSEENRARLQSLRKQLSEAQSNVQATEYERYVSEQKKVLDDLYSEYEEILNRRLDNVDQLMRDMIEQTNQNSSEILAVLKSAGDAVGYSLTTNLSNLFRDSAVTKYMDGIEQNTSNVSGYVNGIFNIVSSMVADSAGVTAYKAYASGGLVDYTGLAHVDGTRSRPEMVLNAADTANFIALRNAMRSNSYLGMINSGVSGIQAAMSGGTFIDSVGVNIQIDHVEDYNDLLTQMQQDPKFEKLISAITADRYMGGNSLGKRSIIFR